MGVFFEHQNTQIHSMKKQIVIESVNLHRVKPIVNVMNPYLVFILAAMVAAFVFETIVSIVNMKALEPKVPKEFSDTFDAEAYSRSQEYTRVNATFGLWSDSIGFMVLLVFWFVGGFAGVDTFARSFGYGSVITGLIFISTLMAANSLLSLPFSLYHTFVIEEKFGFNKTTLLTFITDRLKGLFLGGIIGIPLLSCILWFFESAGSFAWLWCWCGVTIFSLIAQFLAPTLIMPLFNKFTPIEEGELKTALLNYAQSVNFPLTGIYIIDGSKRSNKSNAFFTGFGKNKRIALYDTLVQNHTTDELVAILAHEVGHYKHKHIVQSMVLSFLQSGILFFTLSLFMNNSELSAAFYIEQTSIYASIVFFSLMYSPMSEILGILFNIFSRKNEFEADSYAVRTTHNAQSMIQALKRLSANNLSNLTPHRLYVFLNYSHPPVLQRIEAIQLIKV